MSSDWRIVMPTDPDYNGDDTDPITLERFAEGEVVELGCSAGGPTRCMFRRDSLERCLNSSGPKCPLCATPLGGLPGPAPSGTMTVKKRDRFWVISYHLRDGVQGPQHPKCGAPYRGAHRQAYLPDTDEGAAALRLLQKLFSRGHAFRVGRSLTTGQDDVVTWGSVHHKTSTTGGIAAHGFPSPGWPGRLVSECAALGVHSEEVEAELARESRAAKRVRR